MTTDGIPARSSIVGLITSRDLGPANSATWIAARTASGTASTSEITEIFSVPATSGRILYFGSSLTGCQRKPAVAWGKKRAPGVTSRCTSALVRTGSASLPMNARMSKTERIETSATALTVPSASRSDHRT